MTARLLFLTGRGLTIVLMAAGALRAQTPRRAASSVTTSDVEKLPKGITVPGRLPRGTGLRAAYYTGAVRGAAVHTRVEPVVNVTWKGAAPAPGVAGQGFSVRWTGYIYAPESGLYVLHTEWDDALDIRFGGNDVMTMEKYEPEYFLPDKPPLLVDMVYTLQAGQLYRIDLTCKNVQGVSRAILSWARPSVLGNPATEAAALAAKAPGKLTVVPQRYLYPVLPRPLPEPVAARPAPVARPAAVVRRPPAGVKRKAVPPEPAVTPAAAPALPDLRSLAKGATVALSQLYFTQSTANLLPASRPLLNSLVQKLREQPALRLEIAGHTDNVGEPAKNLRLSQQRANVVRRYLVQQGIDSVRLTARGYGGTRPVADNGDPQQRPRNRRVEIVVR
ncbi:OmpA family protein [Hymenobacter sp. BT635]|uniref:OmpA family protein n=1 Tax=Hymenobacter nitidus TaxID=2880929 RepID=A0ABS8ADH6_9BACT|nr:OmpA family protein [Hymenobacter nitidus]MCB2378465.1 OmpA family protein [Hymenobacter nitidus]